MFMLLLSYPTRNYAGVLPLTMRRWSNATADATSENVRSALNRLVETHFIVVDWETEEVLIRTYIRNDEVYRQPNLLKSALKDAIRVESEVLRRAIKQELLALPGHKYQDSTTELANSLVKTLSEPIPEPIREPIQEPIREGCGVGGYVSSNPTPSPTPPPSTLHLSPSPCTQPPPSSGGSKGGDIVADVPSTREKRANRLKPDWRPSDRVDQRVRQRYPSIDVGDEFLKFQNHHIGRGTRWVEWDRAWWNWMAEAARRQGVGQVKSSVDNKAAGWQSRKVGSNQLELG